MWPSNFIPKVSSKPSVKRSGQWAYLLTLVEETGQSCHLQPQQFLFRRFILSLPSPPKEKAPEATEENNQATGAAGCGRSTWPYGFIPAAALTLSSRLSFS